jgi:hypothetical protein
VVVVDLVMGREEGDCQAAGAEGAAGLGGCGARVGVREVEFEGWPEGCVGRAAYDDRRLFKVLSGHRALESGILTCRIVMGFDWVRHCVLGIIM